MVLIFIKVTIHLYFIMVCWVEILYKNSSASLFYEIFLEHRVKCFMIISYLCTCCCSVQRYKYKKKVVKVMPLVLLLIPVFVHYIDKMVKLFTAGLFVFTFLIFQQQTCVTAIWAAIITYAPSVISLAKTVSEMRQNAFKEPHTMDHTTTYVIDERIQEDLTQIMQTLNNVPNEIHYVNKMDQLGDRIRRIAMVFRRAVKYSKDIKSEKNLSKQKYENFVHDHSAHIKDDIDKIYNIILARHTRHDLIQNLTLHSRKYNSVCALGVSHSQWFDYLLRILKFTTSQYLITRSLMDDFLNISTTDSSSIEKKILLADELVVEDYKRAVKKFKNLIGDASQELWTCDVQQYTNNKRYENKPEYPYFELQAFQKYLFQEKMIDPEFCDTKCYNVRKIDSCSSNNKYNLCRVRLCPNELVNCKYISQTGFDTSNAVACLSNNINATARFKSIFLFRKTMLPATVCDPNNQAIMLKSDLDCLSLSKVVTINPDDGYITREIAHCSPTCGNCECICPENQYFVSLESVLASADKNKVVTGVKLTVTNNMLHIEIKEGLLSANGSISENIWKPINNNGSGEKVPITWNGIREIDLTEIKLPNDRVVTGFKFEKRGNARLHLSVFSTKFDFRTGKLEQESDGYWKQEIPEPARQELDLADRDVPTKNRQANVPDWSTDKFIKFTISSLEKDGGQTTIPFIDTQQLSTEPLSLLSGAGLVHRGREGYGGFLALKLYTYDVSPYVDDDVELDAVLAK